MKTRLLMLLSITSALSGCTYTVDQMVRNDALREKVIKECLKMGISAKDERNCRTAAEAQMKVTGNRIKGLLD